jgi:hypothetical protein
MLYALPETQDALCNLLRGYFPKHKVFMAKATTLDHLLLMIGSLQSKPNVIMCMIMSLRDAVDMKYLNCQHRLDGNAMIVYNSDNFWAFPEFMGLAIPSSMFKGLQYEGCCICLENKDELVIVQCCSTSVCYDCITRIKGCPICNRDSKRFH